MVLYCKLPFLFVNITVVSKLQGNAYIILHDVLSRVSHIYNKMPNMYLVYI